MTLPEDLPTANYERVVTLPSQFSAIEQARLSAPAKQVLLGDLSLLKGSP